ncbi:amidohydrolase family protein [Patulibacter defluvii]|uniref:amidohydrolase family protein n=1 Tax=Patulibacter defluvii TaxID=3095358 RepID=UPI002A758A6D|nr:amidohydrolase family protein [Patulibacter sp. DM4]
MIVDCHTHFVPRSFTRALEAGGRPFGYDRGPAGAIVHPAGPVLPVGYDELHDPAAKLRVLDGQRLDAAVVSITPHLFVHAGEAGERFARDANDDLAAFVAESERLVGLATVPVDRPAAAGRELERAVAELGLRGAILGTSHPDGRDYAREDLEPLFAAAQALGVPLMLHPFYAGPIRDESRFLSNSIGVPLDTLLGTVAIIYSGLLDAYPEVRLVLPHGGGHLPFQLGRLDNGWRIKPDRRGAAAHPPSHYLDRFLFDSVLHDPLALRFLVELAGQERILLGTDAPYLTGEQDPVAFVAAAGCDPDALGATAARVFGIG